MRLNTVKAVTDAALIPTPPSIGEQFARAMTVRSKRPAIPTEQRWVSLPANDRTFFAPPRLRHEFGLDRPYQQHSWTYAIIRALAGPISQIPLIVKYGDRANPQTVLPGMIGYEFQELFDHPHLQLTSTEMKEAHVDNLSLAGECIAIKVGADPDKPIGPYEIPREIYPFSGREFDHVMDPARRRIIGYLHRQPGKRDADAYLAHEVCASRYFNPYYPLRGLAPHEAARQPTQSDWKQMQYNEAFFDNDATPGVVLVSQTELTRPQADELREAWDERNRGYRRRRRTTVLEGGIDVRDLGTSHRDMEFVTLSRYNVEQLCAIYKVPDAEISNYKNLNFATAEAIKTQFWNNTLLPIMSLLEEAWYRQILELPGRGRFWVEFDRSKIDALVENELTKLETAKVAMDMGVPFNEVNERYQLGMKKQEGWGDVGSFPLPRTPALSLLQPVAPQNPDPYEDPGADGPEFPNPNHPGKLPHVPGTPKPPAGGGGSKPTTGGPGESPGGVSGGQGGPDMPASNGPNVIAAEPEIVEEAETQLIAEGEFTLKPGEVTSVVAVFHEEEVETKAAIDTTALELNVWLETRDAGKTARWEQYLRFLRPHEKAFHKRYGNYLHKLRKHQLARLDALHDGKIAAWAEGLGTAWRDGNAQRLVAVRDEIDDWLFELGLWNQQLSAMMHGLYASLANESATKALDELGIPADAGQSEDLRAHLLKAIHDREQLLAKTNETLRGDLYKELERGIEAGETRAQLAERIKHVFNLSNGQAMRIARTETSSMASAARFEAQKSEGLQEHEWLTARDERVRHTHRAQDGVVVPVGATFPNGLLYPLDPQGPANEVVNCFLPGTTVEGSFVAGLKASYAGPAWEIETARGYRLRVTPNHPVLTPKGWVAAKSLRKGDALFSSTGQIKRRMLRNVDNQNCPTAVEKVFQALAANRTPRLVVIGALDLHGDAQRAASEVEIVDSFCELRDEVKPGADESLQNLGLIPAHSGASDLESFGPDALSMNGIHIAASTLPRRGTLTDDRGTIALEALPLESLRIGAASDWHTTLGQESKERRSAHAGFVRELLEACSGNVALDEVVAVREFQFAGHVYDLQTETGWILSNGVVSSNCRCTTMPVLPRGWKPSTLRSLTKEAPAEADKEKKA